VTDLACLLACLQEEEESFRAESKACRAPHVLRSSPFHENLPLLGAANGALLLVQSSADSSRSSFILVLFVCMWEEWLCLARFASSLFLAPRHIPAGYRSKRCAIPESSVCAGGIASASKPEQDGIDLQAHQDL